MKIKLFLILNLLFAPITFLKTTLPSPSSPNVIFYLAATGCTLSAIYGIKNSQDKKQENGIINKIKSRFNNFFQKQVNKQIIKKMTQKMPKICLYLGLIGLAGCGIYQIKENHETFKNIFNFWFN